MFYASIELKEFRIANPEGYPEADLFQAGGIKLDVPLWDALKGHFQGNLKADGLEVLFQRKGNGSNLDGIGGAKGGGAGGPPSDPKPEEKPTEGPKPPEPQEQKKAPDLDLALELTNSKVTIEDLDKGEKLVLEGVGVWMKISNRADSRASGLKIRVSSIDRGGLHVRDLQIDAKEDGSWLDLEKIEAHLQGQGQVKGSGRLQFKGGDAWNAKFDAVGVKLDADMMPIVGSLFPLAAKAEGHADGQLDASFDVRGEGLTWEAIRPTLGGKGSVALTGLTLPAGSVVAKLSEFAGRPAGGIQLKDAGAGFDISDGWIGFHTLKANADDVNYELGGRVSLAGRLDLKMDLMPLVKRFGGGDAYKEASKHVDKIPVTIQGTSTKPEFGLPRKEDLLKGLVEKAVEGGLLDKLKDDKKKK
jgi:hypothetical protein